MRAIDARPRAAYSALDATGLSVETAVRDALRDMGRVVLAVSGGRDSMALLAAAQRVAPDAIVAVATFDHGTGDAATEAAALVKDECLRLGVPIEVGRAASLRASEAEWRAARWKFLRAVAARRGARIATAHTRDDQLETVLLRVLRGSGARGLAALRADGDVVRPLLDVSRRTVASYASSRGVRWSEDPSNRSLRFLRNRVRHEILPALLAVRPQLGDELLDVGRRAAALRGALAGCVDALAPRREGGALVVAAAGLADYDAESLRAIWGEVAARGGIVLDARGLAGLARFTARAATGDRMQLSGALEVVRRRDAIVLTPPRRDALPDAARLDGEGLDWGTWRFRVSAGAPARVDLQGRHPWRIALAPTESLSVRAWRPGDRMRGAGDAAPRRVKRFLRDAGIVGPERVGWPVVLDGEEIVWIPGVRRSDAATVRSGRPEAVYVCERIESAREG